MSVTMIALCMSGCGAQKQTSGVVQSPSGVYTGTLPCADCPGIKTRVELNSDLTYKLQILYIDRSEEAIILSGTFLWNADSNAITFDNPLLGECLLEGDTLHKLVDGSKYSGQNAENYILTKTDTDLVDKYWKLLELYGNPISPADESREAHIIFHTDDNRFSGSTGCNRMMGSYRLEENSRIILSSVATSMMLCIDMETENTFKQALEAVENYSVRGDTLTLSHAGQASLAKFVVVYLR